MLRKKASGIFVIPFFSNFCFTVKGNVMVSTDDAT